MNNVANVDSEERGVDTEDTVFTLQQILGKIRRAFNLTTFITFADYENAYGNLGAGLAQAV
jgi:hypothetical protein